MNANVIPAIRDGDLDGLIPEVIDGRHILYEQRLAEQADCAHDVHGWVVQKAEKGPGQIRYACYRCGRRTRNKASQPYAQHPDRDSYPLLVRAGSDRHTWDYNGYLESDEWQERRASAIASACHRCQVCNGSHALHVHHRSYDRLGAELESDLTVLCQTCHQLFHEHGRLVDWREER